MHVRPTTIVVPKLVALTTAWSRSDREFLLRTSRLPRRHTAASGPSAAPGPSSSSCGVSRGLFRSILRSCLSVGEGALLMRDLPWGRPGPRERLGNVHHGAASGLAT